MLNPINQFTDDQVKELQTEHDYKEQQEYAKDGISTAYEGNQLVTVGDYDCDYYDWKHFVAAQIARLGFAKYVDLTGWDADELIEALAEDKETDSEWQDDAEDFFGAVEGDD